MAGRIAKRSIGVQDDSEDTYRRDIVSTSIRKRGCHPTEVGLTSYKVGNHDESKNDEAMRLQLDLVDEVKVTAKQRLTWY